MQMQLLAAGLLMVLTGLVHSVMGEILIFRRMRQGSIVPTAGQPVLRERHVRILWASWHLVSILGWALAAMLVALALAPGQPVPPAILTGIVVAALGAGSILVLIATKGMHPGWLALLIAAVLGWFGQAAL